MNTMTTGEQVKMIATATVYASAEEWRRFKVDAADNDRKEAAHLAYLAKRALQHPETFRLIDRPQGGRPTYQIRVVQAAEYIGKLAVIHGVDPSNIVESLIRGLSVQ